MALRSVAFVPVLVVAVIISGPASACHPGQECYEKVRTPDVYQNVERPVVVHPGYREVVQVPAVTAVHTERVEVSPARVLTHNVPAVYGSIMRREMVAPASVSYVATAPIVRTVQEAVVVSPGGYRWEHSRGLSGQERKCKVPFAAVTRTVTRQVVVAPGGRVPVVHPAVYRDVARPVVLREASIRHTFVPAEQAFVNRTIVMRPASSEMIEHAPVMGAERHQVLVRHGGYSWQPSR